MTTTAVRIENVSKIFKLFDSPKERLLEAFHPFKKIYHRKFWALRDISFQVEQGTTLGIIGRNGSGKSTLLQIICNILRPSSGMVVVNGRVSALLELGADFNPDFNGRDNVIMKGLRMGLPKNEMLRRMPKIEAFADIGEFIDQPLRTYSSGMFLRLAFATAIHINPDILIMDEIISVGDAQFQHKCYQKLLEFQALGKTIILVTHDIHAVVTHCDRVLFLDNGSLMEVGDPKEVTDHYYELLFTGKSRSGTASLETNEPVNSAADGNKGQIPETSVYDTFLQTHPPQDNCPQRSSYNKNEIRFGDQRAEILDYLVVCGDLFDPEKVQSGDKIDIYLKARFHCRVDLPMFGFSIKTTDGIVVYAGNTRYDALALEPAQASEIFIFKFTIRLNLQSGDFFIDLGIAEKLPEKDTPIDIRYSLIHLLIQTTEQFDGLVALESSSGEVKRVPPMAGG